MAERSSASSSRTPLVIVVCLAIGIVAPLIVGTYDKGEPLFWGIPFFSWYQSLLVIVAVILTLIFRSANVPRGRDVNGGALDGRKQVASTLGS
ncbi:MAG TPA: DUF3311 domain-containing protein [Nocardioidaceae bacterium]|nr:DUF3311 domain-containing protein [Nocardioidaceae bacterium]